MIAFFAIIRKWLQKPKDPKGEAAKAFKKFMDDNKDGPAMPYCDAAGALEKLASLQRYHHSGRVLSGMIVQAGNARSLATGGPMVTPCGHACPSAVVILIRTAAPRRRLVWQYLPCTRQQLRGVLMRDHNRGLISFDELAAVIQVVSKLDVFLEKLQTIAGCSEVMP
jgi:hypothetical protein